MVFLHISPRPRFCQVMASALRAKTEPSQILSNFALVETNSSDVIRVEHGTGEAGMLIASPLAPKIFWSASIISNDASGRSRASMFDIEQSG